MAPPIDELKDHWLTPAELASVLSRPKRTVRRWCLDGTLVEFGFSLRQDRSRKWWIRMNATTL